jgi:predicted nuclease of predicted toxin-antitoxin system
MPIALYMDVHIPHSITLGLRLKAADVLTAQEDGTAIFSDSELLDRATELGRVLFTFDDDLLTEAAQRQKKNKRFQGVIYAHPLRITIGQCLQDLELICKLSELEEVENRVEFLPL